MNVRIVVAVAGFLLANVAVGERLTLTSEQTLRVDFQVRRPFYLEPDVVYIGFDNSSIANWIGTVRCSLFLESQLIGVSTNSTVREVVGPVSLHPAGVWRSSASLFAFGTPTTVDFGDMFSGLSTGSIELVIESGAVSFDREGVQVVLLQATNFAGGYVVEPFPTIMSVAIVPEPIAFVLIGTAVALLGLYRRRGVDPA
ncbi:hypothetical protein [Lacipirellula limnantheis]|uniref:PEP-CTERM protein-sorting domain-containing protein n=1 Tax=Lacipirellula limnantheis TaxID=2528024 RepID=A0A517U072_9BACT|nr:hypothetical protein [Lacipirellula limnantheis]QDT74028.1 hypothetical protein I41_32220 [Lacipirellula limnantheis]